MKFSFILGAAIGYVLGSRAGRERYEELVAIGRRVAGSQTVQSTAGVLQAQLHEFTGRTRERVTTGATARRLHLAPHAANGHSR
ncbi:MAG TPA: hypothetical protein VJ851_01885 [Jatrophihabitans sp.]|nr:hypothetical protein [Jatrophihabitans sp.]